MFGPRLSRVFASRYNALWWSAMVLVTAYCVAAEPPAKMADGTHNANAAQKAKQERDAKEGDPWAGMKAVADKRDAHLP